MKIQTIIFAIILSSCGGISVSGDTNSDNITTNTDNSQGVETVTATITPVYNGDGVPIKCTVSISIKNIQTSVHEFVGDKALEQCNQTAEQEAGEDGEVIINDGTQNSTDNPDDVLGQTT